MVRQAPKVSIVTAYYKNEDLTKKFINHISQYVDWSMAELILVNAGSEEVHHPQTSVLVNLPENQSFSHSMNAGIRAATGEYIIVIGNDVFPTDPQWVEKLIQSHKDTGAWIVAPNNDNPGLDVYKRQYMIKEEGSNVYMRMFPAICWLLPKSTIDVVGLFDEQFIPGCYEDDDYVLRTKALGGHLVVNKDVMVHHELSSTLKLLDPNKAMNENRQRYITKWGDKGKH